MVRIIHLRYYAGMRFGRTCWRLRCNPLFVPDKYDNMAARRVDSIFIYKNMFLPRKRKIGNELVNRDNSVSEVDFS